MGGTGVSSLLKWAAWGVLESLTLWHRQGRAATSKQPERGASPPAQTGMSTQLGCRLSDLSVSVTRRQVRTFCARAVPFALALGPLCTGGGGGSGALP